MDIKKKNLQEYLLLDIISRFFEDPKKKILHECLPNSNKIFPEALPEISPED